MNNPSSKTIFVGNIPYDYDEKSLLETLSIVGPVNSFRIVFDEMTGKSKGYGFCEYKDPESSASALRNIKSIDYNGRQLRINTAENDRTGIVLTDDMIKASKDITYIKTLDTNANDTKFSSILKTLSEEQKFLVLYTMNCLNEKEKNGFRNLLMAQSDEALNAILELQTEFISKFGGKHKTATMNKIV